MDKDSITIQEITTHKKGQTFNCKSIQIEPRGFGVDMLLQTKKVADESL